jgi:hypothetical protein
MEKDIYGVKAKPTLSTIASQKYICIRGEGSPASEEFASKIGVLYSLSYAIRMMPRKGYTPEGYFEYTVYPLEGLWNLSEKGRKSEELIKDELIYTIMIRQPDFVNQDVFDRAFEIAKIKDVPFLEEAYLTDIEDGLSVSMLHKGPFDTEGATFAIMKEFIKENNIPFSPKNLVHREIYLSDARRSKPENLKTILRYRNLD